jgi:hypothetical protein
VHIHFSKQFITNNFFIFWHFISADKVTVTLDEIQKKDYDVDLFLVFEEVVPFEGKTPPTARKDLSEFLLESRKNFIKGFHIVAVNQTAQFYLTRNLHNTVHRRLFRPAIAPFLQAISSLGFFHVYYGRNRINHSNNFLHIVNGSTKLKAYSQLEFKIPMSRLNRTLFDNG